MMINPRLLRPAHKRCNQPHFSGGKVYFAILTGGLNPRELRARIIFKRADEAEMYAKRLLARWIRLYDAAIIIEPSPEP